MNSLRCEVGGDVQRLIAEVVNAQGAAEAERILGALKEDRLESFGTGVVNLNI